MKRFIFVLLSTLFAMFSSNAKVFQSCEPFEDDSLHCKVYTGSYLDYVLYQRITIGLIPNLSEELGEPIIEVDNVQQSFTYKWVNGNRIIYLTLKEKTALIGIFTIGFTENRKSLESEGLQLLFRICNELELWII